MVKSVFGGREREFSEAPSLIPGSYFLPVEGRCFEPYLTHNHLVFNPIRVRVRNNCQIAAY